jgi:hypothetical protein
MKVIYLNFILFFMLLITSCKQENNQVIDNKYSSESDIDIELVEEIKVDVSEHGYSMYDNKFVFKDGKNLLLFGYSGTPHQLVLVNLTNRVVEDSLTINKEGPNSIETVFKTFVHNLDSIFIVDYQKLKIIDIDGNIKYSLKTLFSKSDLVPDGNVVNYNDANIYFDANSKSFYGFYFPFKNYESKLLSTDTPFICRINLITEEIEILPIYYPDIVRNNYDIIPERMPNINFIDNKIFYSFPFLSDIYEYDLISKKSVSYGGKSRFSENFSLINNDPLYNYRLTGTVFYNVEYISTLDCFLRGHWGSQETFQNDGSQSSNFTKDGYIIFFDKFFNYINEIKIDDRYWIEEYFVIDDYLYLYKKQTNPKDEDFVTFGKFRLIQRTKNSSQSE